MIPESISATALSVAEACPARYHAEHINRSKGMSVSSAATVGSTVHGAFEMFVKTCFINKTEQPSEKLIKEFYALSYAHEFGSYDNSTDEYADGFDMVTKWYKRVMNDGTFEPPMRVISAEIKSNFLVPTSIGDLPFNYIWDRFDEIRPGVFKVVDYKSNRWNFTFDQFKKKIQVRAYAMAAAIQLKRESIDYKEIFVEYDMLRHRPLGMSFTRDDNKAFWEYLKKTVEERIIAIPDTDASGDPIALPERLNPECLFCVRKPECGALKKNIAVGGIHSLDFDSAINLRAQLDWQQSGINALVKELDAKILTEAQEKDISEHHTEDVIMQLKVRGTRGIDGERAENVLGPKLFAKYGKKNLTMKEVDKLLKGTELSPEQKNHLKGLIFTTYGEPYVKVEPKNPIDD